MYRDNAHPQTRQRYADRPIEPLELESLVVIAMRCGSSGASRLLKTGIWNLNRQKRASVFRDELNRQERERRLLERAIMDGSRASHKKSSYLYFSKSSQA